MSLKYQHSSKTKAAWEALNPVIVADEIVVEKDTKRLKVGDGVKSYSELEYIKILNYKSYVAKITQIGTAAPTVVVLENTIGDIVWTRTAVGLYVGTLSGAFSENTILMQDHNVFFSTSTDGLAFLSLSRISDSVLSLATVSTSEDKLDDALDNTIIEIRVYN